jgi:hypothetical protein
MTTSPPSMVLPGKRQRTQFPPVGQCLPVRNRWSEEVQAQLSQLIDLGGDPRFIEVVPGGFIVSANGRRISSEQVRMLWQARLQERSRAWINPYPQFVACAEAVSQIKVFIRPAPEGWHEFITRALQEWNNPQLQSCIDIQIVDTELQANCVAEVYYKEDGLLGYADWPENYRVGHFVQINSYYLSDQYDERYYYNTIVHEMGHAMGLSHSGGQDGIFGIPDQRVAGTRDEADPGDMMFSEGHPWQGISADEQLAVRTIWPRTGKR